MIPVLLRAASFALIILIGFLLKHFKVVDPNAGFSVKKILINVTLPCAIIVNFAKIESAGPLMIMIAVSGLILNVAGLLFAVFFTSGKSDSQKALCMLSMPSYNIGAFCLPFVQSFLPGLGTVAACMFDVGNSVMCTGGTYSIVAEVTNKDKKGQGLDLLAVGKRLLTSPPLMSYVIMFLLTVIHIHLPEFVLTLISPLAGANTFVAMLMIGLLFHLEFKKEYLSDILKILTFRHIFAIVCALIVYFLLPLDLLIRQALVLVLFAPISAVAPAFVGMCGGDEGKASAANSMSIICSIIDITILLLLLGLQ